MTQNIVITAKSLTKKFGTFLAVDHIDFEIPSGQCFGFLGPNGAGKTSTMRMLYLASPITSGDLTILNQRIDDSSSHGDTKARIGVVPQDDNLDQDLTVHENLMVFCRFYRLYGAAAEKRVAELLAFVSLEEKANALVMTLSGGMKRRLLIARGLIGSPDILVLDEPTTGLDPQIRQLLWERIRDLKNRGTTILLTTHYMEEAEQLCDDLVIMDHGKIVERGKPRDLITQHFPSQRMQVTAADGTPFTRPANLEDVFLKITGRKLDE